MNDLGKQIEIPLHPMNFDTRSIQKMTFIMNALEKGWAVKKREGAFVFSKKHEGKREVFMDNYLETFVKSNFDMDSQN
jgi:hypothetical protein